MRLSRQLALLPLLLAAGACGSREAPVPPGPRPRPAAPATATPFPAGPRVLPPGSARRPPSPPRLRWPRGFRVVDSGGLGPDSRPSFWWILDAGGADPPRAVERVREALSARFGKDRAPGSPATLDDRAAGAWIGPGKRAAITATRVEGRTEVRIVLATTVE